MRDKQMDFLPELKELRPINNNSSSVFSECYFNRTFNNLSFEKKLQVLCDIVRQSIYPNGFPNPDTDILKMNGNCYTAAHCFVRYAKHLNIGLNSRCALVRKRTFDPDIVTTIHVVALIDSSTGETYQVDPTPFVGYKYGSVENITFKRIYEECVIIDNDIEQYLYQFRKIIYDDSVNRLLDLAKIEEIVELCHIVEEIPILKGYAALVLKIAYKHLENKYDKDKIHSLINSIKPCNSANERSLNEVRNKLKIQTAIWMEELRDLKQNNSNPKRQQELASAIIHENKWLDDSYEKYANIGGKKIRLSSINPRFFLENRYETLVTEQSTHQLEKSDFVFFEYDLDLQQPTEQLGLNPRMFYSTNEEQLGRNIRVSLIKNDSINKLVLPYDLKTRSYSEDSIKLLIGYPEHQVMTRFMYPNPRLVKVKNSYHVHEKL